MSFFPHCPKEPYLFILAVTYLSKGVFQGSHLLAVLSSNKRQLRWREIVDWPARAFVAIWDGSSSRAHSVHVLGVAEVGVTDDLLHLKNLCSKSKGKSKASSP
ncbi:hypothetical protein Tco_0864177 [Tanacetum coccineum]